MTGNQSSDFSDLHVRPVSDALTGRKLDVVVSGSIGAVESVKFIRSLRRLGADITPWLTHGGSEFITPQSLTWAAARDAVTGFSGAASHIATGDACIVAPASASLIGRIAAGMTDTPASALITSYLGQGKPVLLLANMHDSLFRAPPVQANLQTIAGYGVTMLTARTEEGKQKFPLPDELADISAHVLNSKRHRAGRGDVLVTMGTTRGYIDDVRYISNYSSGALGTEISRELYRHGFSTHIVAGPCPVKPAVYSSLHLVETNDDMEDAMAQILRKNPVASVLAASVLDFTPERKQAGKISSASTDRLEVGFARTKKLIAKVNTPVKVGFKLESGLTEGNAAELARQYQTKYNLSLFVINDLGDVDSKRHRARIFDRNNGAPSVGESKPEIARAICQHIIRASSAQ